MGENSNGSFIFLPSASRVLFIIFSQQFESFELKFYVFLVHCKSSLEWMMIQIHYPNEMIFNEKNMTPSNICMSMKLLLKDESISLNWMNSMYALCPNAMTLTLLGCEMTQLMFLKF